MTIKSFFHYTSFFLVCLILTAALALIMTSRELNVIATQNQLATEIVRGIFELNLLTGDYLIHHGQRVQRQWFARHSSLGSLLKRAHFSGSGTGEALKVMADDHQDIKSLFEELMKTSADQTGATDEVLHLLSRFVVQNCRPLAELVDAAVNICAELCQIVDLGIYHLLRFQRGGAVVEVREWLAAHCLGEDRKI